MTNGQRFRGAFITVTSLFFMWGFITVLVDALIPRLKDVFELTYLQAGLVQFAWFTAYGIISIPGGRLIKRLGYKNGILIGLSLAAIGCLIFYPAASTRLFALFLLALFVVASGITILQVAANPYISVLGPEEGASSRLNLAQAFNSLGTTIAPIISATYLLSDTVKSGAEQAAMAPDTLEAYRSTEAGAVQVPFVLLALAFLLLAGIIWRIALPRILEGQGSSERSLSDVFSNGRLRAGALGIFVYVGAEVALGSYMVNYGLNLNVHELMQSSPLLERMAGLAAAIKGQSVAEMDPKGKLGVLLTFYWGGAMVGRFIGAALMQKVRPGLMLGLFATLAMAMVISSACTTGLAALLLLLGVGLCNSIMFPTIFTLGIEQLGDAKPQGSGILCTAIVGGAVIPPAFGALVDASGFGLALLLPAVCYAYIAGFGFRSGRMDMA
ncbi:MAG: L-fucose:H+ symporter permease [Bacteroidota bacterium]|nr:L-fucose:H+ symporter permease [Bacteroidota bacterium]